MPDNNNVKTANEARRSVGYSSVSIKCDEAACANARAMSGKRYLREEAPALPLNGCSPADCSCRYFAYGDRRSFLGNRRSRARDTNKTPTWLRWLWRSNRREGSDRRKLKVSFTNAPEQQSVTALAAALVPGNP